MKIEVEGQIGVAGVVVFVAQLAALCVMGFFYFILFWWLEVEVVVGGGGGGCGCGHG